MADNEELDAVTVRGNDWEVVSLTASAYAAAPGPKAVEQGIDDNSNVSGEVDGETSDSLFMSRHFAFPITETLLSDADKSQMRKTDKDKDLVSDLVEEGYKSAMKVEDDHCLTGFNLSDDFSELQLYDGKVDKQSICGAELEASETLLGLNLIENEEIPYAAAAYGSSHADAPVDEKVDPPNLIGSSERGSDVPADVSELNYKKEESSEESNLPCEAWWKRHAASLYAHAKETNTFWSIFIAAAVMGLVVLGHRWRKERRQILQVKWHVVVKEEKSGSVIQPVARLKDVILGGSRAHSLFRGASYEL
uniref:ATG8-interacting protein 1 n=1 Tax=Kalanchoe fedtschenkoi TaxID=63787 RepID=A0A7N0UU15_KALFE